MPWFKRANTGDTTSRPVFSAPRAGSVERLEAAIRKVAAPAPGWLHKCSNLDKVTSPKPTPQVGQRGASALVGVLRPDRLRTVECEAKTLRRDWGTGDTSSSSNTDDTCSSTTSVTDYVPNDPYGPISKALQDYRVAFQQRASHRSSKQTQYNKKSDDNYPTTHSASSGSSSDCSQDCAGCALPLGINNTVKKVVTWVDVPRCDKTGRAVVAKGVTWSRWIQVFQIENVLDMGE